MTANLMVHTKSAIVTNENIKSTKHGLREKVSGGKIVGFEWGVQNLYDIDRRSQDECSESPLGTCDTGLNRANQTDRGRS